LVVTGIFDLVSISWTIVNPPAGWTAIGDAQSSVLPDGRVIMGSLDSKLDSKLDAYTLVENSRVVCGGMTGTVHTSSPTMLTLPDAVAIDTTNSVIGVSLKLVI